MEGERTVRYLDGPSSLCLCSYRFCEWDSYSSLRQKLSVRNPQQTVGSEATHLGVSCGFWLSQPFFQILAFLELQFSSDTPARDGSSHSPGDISPQEFSGEGPDWRGWGGRNHFRQELQCVKLASRNLTVSRKSKSSPAVCALAIEELSESAAISSKNLKGRSNVRTIAIIAHVDHEKTTLVDGMLRQAKVFRDAHPHLLMSVPLHEHALSTLKPEYELTKSQVTVQPFHWAENICSSLLFCSP
ncbi:hypothetical protein R1flu_020092 [Riccia fluitans]|uniref:Tr-type G domain-containing protein n=1 Tax=Riccia fluitans TaxID=41844 RepID=A0ABD1ZPE1_9MARC